MGWWGKIVGAGVGFAVGGIAGGVLGLGLGALADHAIEDDPNTDLPELDIDARFVDDDYGRFVKLYFREGVPKGAAMVVCIHDRRKRTLQAVSAYAENGRFVINRAIERGKAEFYIPYSALKYRRPDHYTLSVTVLFMEPGADKPTTVGHKPFPFTLPEPQKWSKVAFLQPLMGLCMAVMRADGEVSKRGVKIVRRFFTDSFDIPKTSLLKLRDLMKTEPSEDIQTLCQNTQRRMPALAAMDILELLAEISRCDGQSSQKSRKLVQEISVYLGIPENRWREVEKKLGLLVRPSNPWDILGVDRGASVDEVKRAYKEKLATLHPDKVARMDQEIQSLAENRTIELRAAYETVMDDHA